ncbi:hypothetical protein AKJ44_01255 [candidate division MSBL1 archaeon SCGC-AAA261F17]|uniref:Uncharacterized protein n=1 Tax=candidate division MSBL1 archaeon SCGC-AAA261F17 TaxID=1698274 RepID=A0A133V6R7_9EURY|nr:hypothetical protein AKJ44_01255 [candidate division MSBL1 archaeon SCGC-AAA261F17]
MVIGKEAWSEVYMSRVLEQIDGRILKSLIVLAIISVAFDLLVLSGHGVLRVSASSALRPYP